MLRRRREADPSRDAFEAVLAAVEEAKRSLLTAMPSPRGVPLRSLADALIDFESGLRQAEALMPAWATTETDPVRQACEEAIRVALDASERLRSKAPALDYEGLVAVLGDLMAPLEAFEEAESTPT
ncbi:MAG: hypothetical protein M3135_05015 [Actinomycetota bacterium]|nr:hypothetical protein [Actinomycetota bacterium]